MEALRRSLDSVSAERKSPAKASLPRTRAAGKRAERGEADASSKPAAVKRRKAS